VDDIKGFAFEQRWKLLRKTTSLQDTLSTRINNGPIAP